MTKQCDELVDLYRFDDPFNGGVTRLASWPEGLLLWHNGKIVWKSWEPAALPQADELERLRGLLSETVDALGQATGLLKACEDDIDIEVVIAIRDGDGNVVRTLATLHSPTIIENGSAVLRRARAALSPSDQSPRTSGEETDE